MSANGMQPQFTDREGYRKWITEWRAVYADLSQRIRDNKLELKQCQREGWHDEVARIRGELWYQRAMAHKTMSQLDDARIHWSNVRRAREELAKQNDQFPLTLVDAKSIDFHFNKKSLQWNFLPMWTLKAKGKTYYLSHINCEMPCTTHESPDNPHTKGAIRVRRGTVRIDAQGVATISAE